ncbi:MAG: aldehyde dehydrogenase [Saprospiraceae bacterium]|nr:aldehyde dehydrogenase [Bacteroidia bacterium]NNE15637.1 aldehyde dehydrogenase [Saprospiraceae bacterium]NNL90640.1 aldehyde dehydrogenase [Saprospiraceae bacterium]
MIEIQNYINGELISAVEGGQLDNINPATGEVYAKVTDSGKDDIENAYQAAKAAFNGWSETPISERSRIMMRIADMIEKNLDELALAESIDNGKPLTLAKKVDIPRASANFRFFANAITQFASESHSGPGNINYTLREPLGVVGCISPWNLPLYLFTWKIAPALAAGNTVIAKPSEVTPMTAFLLSQICIDAGLPSGVLNIVHGLGHKTGDAMSRHPGIKAISFTGSTKVGSQIASIAAPMFKKLSLELGGKNPNIIFADCDYDKMLKTTVRSSFANQGQICLCGSRIFVERKLYEKFRSDFLVKVKELKVGDPLDDATKIGAVVSKAHFEKILSYIKLAKQEGGRILCGGNTVHPEGNENGYYIEPTVIVDLPYNCRTNTEEIFGPVVTLTPFDTEEDVIKMANCTEYGLSTTVWTSNLNRAHQFAKKIDAGIVWINTWLLRDLRTPFGGTKNSGVGREGGFEALRFFTEPKNVCIEFE